jgi:hypothetical protein
MFEVRKRENTNRTRHSRQKNMNKTNISPTEIATPKRPPSSNENLLLMRRLNSAPLLFLPFQSPLLYIQREAD